MKAINLNKEQNFIYNEFRNFKEREIAQLIRELLLCADVILLKYSDAKSRKMKSFYKGIYFKIKNHYLKQI